MLNRKISSRSLGFVILIVSGVSFWFAICINSFENSFSSSSITTSWTESINSSSVGIIGSNYPSSHPSIIVDDSDNVVISYTYYNMGNYDIYIKKGVPDN